MPDFSIGVDLGGTNLRIAAVSSQGELLEKVTLGTKVALGRDHVINEMCDAIQRLSGKYKETGKLLGAGIGVPGIIDMQTGMLRKSANLPGWEDYPVRAEIERRLRSSNKEVRVVLENDANVAALGEQWLGAARGVPNMAVVTLGTGIGGGIVLGGKIWHGMNGMAGEFGHVTVEPEGHPCGCGSRGCAEQYASASAIVRLAREAIASGLAIFHAKQDNGTVPADADPGRYLGGIIRNRHEQLELQRVSVHLLEQRIRLGDLTLAPLHLEARQLRIVMSPSELPKAFVDSALGASTAVDLSFWGQAAAEALSQLPGDQKPLLYRSLCWRIAATYATNRDRRADLIARLADALAPP